MGLLFNLLHGCEHAPIRIAITSLIDAIAAGTPEGLELCMEQGRVLLMKRHLYHSRI